MSVKVDLSGLKFDEIRKATRNSLIETTNKATGNLLNLAVKAAPHDTGELRQKHTMKVKTTASDVEGTVEAYAPHAVYVHEGTGIYARKGNGRKKGWFYTVESGRSKYKGEHWTRGGKANPWMDDTIEKNIDNILRLYRWAVKGK